MKRILALLLVILMVTMTACSSDGESRKKRSKKTSTEDVVFQKTETDEDANSEVIKEAEKEWVIATDMAFPPFNYADEDGDFAGFEVELLEAIAQDQGFEYRFDIRGFSEAIAATQTGSADVVMTGIAITEERISDGWIFSDPYYNFVLGCAVAEKSDYDSTTDLKGKTVAVMEDSSASVFVDNIRDNNMFTAAVYYDSIYDTINAVADGDADVCVIDLYQLNRWIYADNYGIRVIEDFAVETDDVAVVVFNEDNREFITMFNEGLKNIKANGTYQELVKKYRLIN